jgi:hypothetical protein
MEWVYTVNGGFWPVSAAHQQDLDQLEALLGLESSVTFPLSPDFPILVENYNNGSLKKVLVTYGQDKWDFSSVSGGIHNLYFYKVSNLARGHISAECWKAFKMVMAYLWITVGKSISVKTYFYYYKQFRALFVLCTTYGADVLKAQLTEEQAFNIFGQHKRPVVMLRLVTILYMSRRSLGFHFLSPWEVVIVQRVVSPNICRQTPCIPWRIWDYQKDRLHEFLSDFISASDRIGRLISRLIELYDESDYSKRRVKGRVTSNTHNVNPLGKESDHFFTFHHYSDFFRISPLLKKWMVPAGRSLETIISQDGARIFSSYLSAVSYVGMIYLANYSGMRKGELEKLRSDCFLSDHDDVFGKVYFLRSGTSKTINDPDALWVTNDYSGKVVEALHIVSRARIDCAKIFNRGDITKADIDNPLLLLRAYEPWGRARGEALDKSVDLVKNIKYAEWKIVCPNLYDLKAITITQEDFLLAKKYTPTLDAEEFAVGNIWPFAMHQLRRTLFIDGTESGVSRQSSQYQAKHRSRTMTNYYVSNFQGNINSEMRKGYFAEIVASLGRSAMALKADHFVSVYGDGHKSKLIEFVEISDIKKLNEMAENSSFSIRETFFGICLKKGFCSSGGISYLGDCGSCAEGLGDVRKIPILVALKADLESRLSDLNEGDLDFISIKLQIDAIEYALNVLRGKAQ